MEEGEQSAVLAAELVERRAHARFTLDENSAMSVVENGLSIQCRIINLSLSGCCLRATEKIPARIHTRVEVTFKVNGIAFRLMGEILWIDTNQQIGIRFIEIPARRRSELVQVLSEVQMALTAQADKDAIASQLKDGAGSEPASSPAQAAAPQCKPSDGERERRAHPRFEIFTTAAIFLVKLGSELRGDICDISLGGCRIHTDEPFPLGIYTRVEVEFHTYGFAFRLGGVVQSLHDRNTVGIRFLDMSERKKQQLMMLIEEILAAPAPGEANQTGMEAGH